uniref:ABC transporter ATP-binding protein n=1 Tax=candidate division WOR-3 bacterium TaxID=2052148 RepID=A0A7C4YEY6_UNCW3
MMHDVPVEKYERKVSNTEIYKWISKYLKPYTLHIILNFFLLLLITIFELAYPYFLKIGIDRYIMPNVKEVYSDYSKGTFTAEGRKFIKIEGISQRIVEAEVKRNAFSKENFYLVSNKIEKPEGVKIIQGDEFYLISQNDFSKLPVKERFRLRMSEVRMIRTLSIIFILITILNVSITFIQAFHLQKIGQLVSLKMREDVISKFLRMSISYFEKNPLGRLVTRATNDVNAINEMFTSVLVYLFKDFLLIIGILGFMMKMSLRLFLIVLIILPLIIIITYLFRIVLRNVYREVRRLIALINTFLSETFSGIKVVQAFVQEEKMKKKFFKINKEYFDITIKMMLVFSTFRPLISFVRSFGLALLIYYGGKGIVSSIITFGSLVAFINYLDMLFRPIEDLSEKFNVLESSMAASERIYFIMREKEEAQEDNIKRIKFEGDIEFKNIWFAYEDEWILKDVSFSVKKGERIGIVGYTGSGKTTLMKLLTRFYDPQKGKILIDGIDIKEINRMCLRRQIGSVYQEPFLFNATLKDNITLFENIPEDKISIALEVSNLNKVMERKKIGLDFFVGPEGSNLSVGEKQLVTFARAVAFDTPILVLDEATANIDPETEYLIKEALGKVMKGRTSIIIAHRLSTLKEVQRIIVLHKGKIVEEGTQEELIKKEGIFAYLFKLQSVG